MDKQKFINRWPELPEQYLSFLENYPQKMKDAGDLSQVEFLNEFCDIEHFNIEVEQIDGIEHSDYFVIGHSGCGDYYLMELDSEEPGVILWNHETGELEEDEEYSTIEEFAGQMLETRLFVESRARKPWWKFF